MIICILAGMMRRDLRVLVIDDDASILRTFRDLVGTQAGIQLETAGNGRDGLERLRRGPYEVAIVDLNMPIMDGMEFLRNARKSMPAVSVVMLTAHGSIEKAVEAMKVGAADFLTKPFKLTQIQVVLDRLRKLRDLESENRRLREELGDRYSIKGLVGRTPLMQRVNALVERVRFESCNVLISGESGTGKELVARAIHYDGPRAGEPFVPLDCGSVHPSLLESELFGHLKGSFTGATEDRVGLFERASGGTLFLDEVGELPLQLQSSLLRVLEEKKVRPVGGTEFIEANVRILAATNRDLDHEVSERRFRRDLYYRLNVVRIDLPPLRRRKDDIPLLVDHYLSRSGEHRMSRGALYRMLRHDWPGNVRELVNALECACAVAGEGDIREEHLRPLRGEPAQSGNGRSLRDMEMGEMLRLLRDHDGNTGEVAGILGIDRSTLYRKIKRYGIDLEQFRA